MRMRLLIFAILVVSACSYSLKYKLSSPEDHKSILRVLKKRSNGCSSGCVTSCNSASSASCSNCIYNDCCNNCCQNQCNVCSTNACQSNTNCAQCCRASCSNTTITPSVTTPSPTPSTTPSTTPCPTLSSNTISPTIPGVTYPSTVSNSNHSTFHSNTIKSNTYNKLGLSNSISIPINIKNTNVISNHISTSCNSGISGKNCDDVVTITPRTSTTTTSRPIIPTLPSNGDGNYVIMIVPEDENPHLYPITNLPCYDGGCTARRTSWSGSLCGGWHEPAHGNLNLGSKLDYGNLGYYGDYAGGYRNTWPGTGYPSTWSAGYSNSWTDTGSLNTWTGGYPSTWSGTGTWSGGYPWHGAETSSIVGSGLGGYSSPWYGYGLGGSSIPWSGISGPSIPWSGLGGSSIPWSGPGGYTLPWSGLSTSAAGARLGLSGCSNVNQDCTKCGSQFYDNYAHNSMAYGSCYGCFV